MRPLYAIAGELAQLLDLTDDGDLPIGVEARLDELAMELPVKVEGCCAMVRNLEAEEKALKEESDRFAKRAQVAANQVKRMKDYIKANLERVGMNKLEAGRFAVRIQANGQPSVKFDGDASTLPEEYQRVKVELNNAAVVAAWKEKQQLPEGISVVKGSHIRIV